MKKIMSICLIFLIGSLTSVASNHVRVKPHFATDLGVSKKQNEVVINAIPSMDMVYNYEASEVINYCQLSLMDPLTTVEVEGLFSFDKLVSGHSFIHKNKVKPKKIYLLNCSIKQCSTGSLICSV